MSDRALLAALLKLNGKSELPASQFTASQRSALDRFIRQTGAARCIAQGRGAIYQISDQALFSTHVLALSPAANSQLDDLPLRARHIAHARSSKAGSHQHGHYYLLIKSVGEDVRWREADRGIELALDQASRDYGAATLMIAQDDAWSTDGELWLVENQALFDRTDWLPNNTSATIAYYGGQLNGHLLHWLAKQSRAAKVVHFPDYDGVGLANFARLYAALGDQCQFWLMPDWPLRLERYGSVQLWRDTLRDFTSISQNLPDRSQHWHCKCSRPGWRLNKSRFD